MTRKEFEELSREIILLDGATGSNMIAAGMHLGTCAEQWILEHPDVLIKLQQEYVKAGSQIIYAPTFGANRKNLASKGLEKNIREMNLKLVELSRQAAGGKALVAGNLTTTGNYFLTAEDENQEIQKIYEEQISYLVEAGVDLLAAETMIGIDEAVACVKAAREICDLPVMCSMTVNASGALYCGGNLEDALLALQDAGADAVGINCSVEPEQLQPLVARMKAITEVPLIVKPNAGLPKKSATGKMIYGMGPEAFAMHMERLVLAGADIIGGCCGTTPAYIAKMKERILTKTNDGLA